MRSCASAHARSTAPILAHCCSSVNFYGFVYVVRFNTNSRIQRLLFQSKMIRFLFYGSIKNGFSKKKNYSIKLALFVLLFIVFYSHVLLLKCTFRPSLYYSFFSGFFYSHHLFLLRFIAFSYLAFPLYPKIKSTHTKNTTEIENVSIKLKSRRICFHGFENYIEIVILIIMISLGN